MIARFTASPPILTVMPGAIETFVVSGEGIVGPLVVTAPPALRVSLEREAAFSSSVVIRNQGPFIGSVRVFVECLPETLPNRTGTAEITINDLTDMSITVSCILGSPNSGRAHLRSKLRAVSGITREVSRIIDEYVSPYLKAVLVGEEIDFLVATISEKLREDFGALAGKDPAAQERIRESFSEPLRAGLDSAEFLYKVYPSMQAVLWYRIANEIYYSEIIEDENLRCQIALEVLFPEGRKITGIDIDPSARIGRRFVLDHGAGTVIGRRTIIGDDCYMLHSVNLGAGPPGAKSTAVDDSTQRHPRIGNGVTIFGYATILGPVTIADGCTIGTRCLVTESLPPGAKTRIINQFQYTTGPSFNGSSKAVVYGVVPVGEYSFEMHGKGFHPLSGVMIVDHEDQRLARLVLTVVESSPAKVTIQIDLITGESAEPIVTWSDLVRARLKLQFDDGGCLYISQAAGLREILKKLFPGGPSNE